MYDNRMFLFNVPFLLIILIQLWNPVKATDGAISVAAYFPEIGNDLTKVTWAHAVNNRAKLNASLHDNSMMIEADVLMGQLTGSAPGENPLPIMGHPPTTTSDLSLEEFLTTILKSNKRKGVKLDFKSKEVFAGAENILEEILVKPEADFPIWLNADVAPGPVASTVKPVDPDYFVSTVVKKFPSALLSVGWTTRFGGDIQTGKYTDENIANMTDILSRNSVIHRVTFPVRAAIAANSGTELTGLVRSSVPGTTLTIWMSNDSDKVNVEALKYLILDLGRDKVYLDLPAGLIQELNLNNNNSAASPLRISVATSYMVLFGVAILSMLSL
ncbi:protein FAM151B [Lycorma delicatula]|uniref:protein FAM151B n=1 Tax=Lycorma delicatula TaxID=130591 RepID=UPI003F519D01